MAHATTDARRDQVLLLRYGLPKGRFAEMVAEQDGRCAICGEAPTTERLLLDHSHATGEHRGLLCRRCNLLLGFARDNASILLAAIAYLAGEPVPPVQLGAADDGDTG